MKTNKNSWFILLSIIMIPLMASTCDSDKDKHECITFVNKSDMKIYVYRSTLSINAPSDTLLYCGSVKTSLIPDDKFCFEYAATETWDDFFRTRGYIQFMVFPEPYNPNDCTEEYIKKFTETSQLKRYQLTKEDLDRMNWTVVYPSEE